jgi:hypothetical protein
MAWGLITSYVVDFVYAPEDVKTVIHGWIRSRAVHKLATASEHFQHHAWQCVESARFYRQLAAFVKKNKLFTVKDAKDVTLRSFIEDEAKCVCTNARLDEPIPEEFEGQIARAQRYIARVLGDYSYFLEELPHLMRVTSGATATRSRRRSQPHRKIRKTLDLNRGTLPYAMALAKRWGYDQDVNFSVLNHNRVEVVPKNYKTGRTIACEPTASLPFQLAFDSYGKRRLRKWGIDLSDQTRNQQMAIEGSIHRNLATIDLKSASNTVSFNTVCLLLPWEWFNYLNAHRSPTGLLPGGEVITYQMFSSMGNGSTFVLETLIFAACCHAVHAERYSVYGDDIVVSEEKVPDLLALLRFLGFEVNSDKSFYGENQPFRESCGVDSYNGIDITPFYITDFDTRKTVLSHIVNGFASLCTPEGLLIKRLAKIVKDFALPLVPYNANTTSGVFITVGTAYEIGSLTSSFTSNQDVFVKNVKTRIKVRHLYTPVFKGLIQRTPTVATYGPRAYVLWHIAKAYQQDAVKREQQFAVSFENQYSRGWIYFTPVGVVPSHIYMFEGVLLNK